jgi:RNA polymerase sigma-70 factor (ECF subfamily)
MHLEPSEIQRISGRIGDLSNRSKLLASYIAVRADDKLICFEMGILARNLDAAIRELCTELHMTYLEPTTWRAYVRAAVLLIASPDPKPTKADVPKPPKARKVTQKMLADVEPIIAAFVNAGAKSSDPKLACMLSLVPKLFAFALSLCGNLSATEELVQECLVRAYGSLDAFEAKGNLKSNMAAWLFTIVKNARDSEYRKRRRIVEDIDDKYSSTLTCAPEQLDYLELSDVRNAINQLPVEQRDAVLLISSGLTYEEVAARDGSAVGTIKSRLNRARKRIASILGAEANDGSCAGNYLSHAADAA